MAKKKDRQNHKTNAVRMVEAAGVPYSMYTYEAPDGFLDGVSVATALGQDMRQVFKTLVTVGRSRENYVCVIPVDRELDLKKAARAAGVKAIEMLPLAQLLPTTGYLRGGCSPIGMKKVYPTFIDETAQLYEEIAVSAGMRGQQLILHPDDLICYTDMTVCDLTE